MNNIKRISDLPEANSTENEDLFLISKAESYNRLKSKYIRYGNVVESLRISFEDELNTLAYINENFVDDSKLSFGYDSKSHIITLATGGVAPRTIDAADFIKDGMISDVSYDKKTQKLTITFNLDSGKKDPVTIDLSDLVDVYTPGNGLCCENHQFRIDTDVVELKDNLKSAAYKTIEYFSLSGHVHSLDEINNTSYSAINVKNDTTVPTISLDTNIPTVMFKSTSQNDLSLQFTSNATKDGCYTWEVMINSDVDITSYTSNAVYVGNDFDDIYDNLALKDSKPTIHVFSVRLIKIGTTSYWQINYNYSFNK